MNTKTLLTVSGLAAVLLSTPAANSQEAKAHTYDAFEIARSAYMDFKRIEPGTFTMGSQDEKRQEGDSPPHQVTITKPFYMGKYEVTQAQWEAVMGSNPSKFQVPGIPAEQVSWDDIQPFLAKLNVAGTRRVPSARQTRKVAITLRCDERPLESPRLL